MLQFLIPFKSRSVSKNWGLSSALLRQCLLSLLAQDSDQFQIAICGHDRPSGEALFRHNKVTWIDAPYAPLTADADIDARRVDKRRKQTKLLEHAMRQGAGGHLMFVDADDLLDHHFTARLEGLGPGQSALVRVGYVYSIGDNRFWRCLNFQKRCGTCGVFPVPASLPASVSFMDLTSAQQFAAVHMSLGGHPNYERNMREAQLDVRYIDEPVVVRLINYGDSHGKGHMHTVLTHMVSRLMPRRKIGTRSVWIGETLTLDVRERFNLL